jgi:hypothetical protein
MRDGTERLETFLTAALEGTPILITGHSLGGCLASALAPCVANWVGGASALSIYTIAAPSPGNADFAAYYNTLFTHQSGHSMAFRFFNSLDVVPNAWASLATVETYYPPLVSCPPDITRIIGRAETAVAGKYTQLGDLASGSAIELSGTIIPPFGAHIEKPKNVEAMIDGYDDDIAAPSEIGSGGAWRIGRSIGEGAAVKPNHDRALAGVETRGPQI